MIISEDDEIIDEKRRHIRIRLRFKSLVRRVIANLYWLKAELHQKSKKLQISHKRKGRYALSIKEKAILRTPPECRTEEDINFLMNVIGYLKCFRKYSEDLKRALVAHTQFEYYPPYRVLVRQNRKSLAMYFIISGHLEVSVTRYVLEIGEETVVGRYYFTDGDSFGDTSLLHDTPRTATITTLAHCEVLVLKKVDFDRILRSVTMVRINEVENAIESIPQFKGADKFLIRDLCIVSQIVKFKKNDIVLGDGNGRFTYVHFIISGSCKVIEHIPLKVYTLRNGTKKEVFYTLKEEKEYNDMLNYGCLQSKSILTVQSHTRLDKTKSTMSRKSLASRKSIESRKSVAIPSRVSVKSHESAESVESNDDKADVSAVPKSDTALRKSTKFGKIIYVMPEYPDNVKLRLMEICTLNPVTAFNVGEFSERRRVVATNPVTCLLVPSYWLLHQSTIWKVLRDHLNKIIPHGEGVFEIYKQNKEWQQYTKGYVKSLIAGNKKVKTCNNIYNVPYSVRIRGDFDFRG